ncbi:MAG TPA: tetratricopeptide repeat protein, partial [Planctomycetota bacterium]|nr:tetratricopeptide repeat protein [Planctomycetota bacterium]
LLLAGTSLADRIFTVEGSTIDDVTISKESLNEVEYKTSSGRTVKTIPSYEVLDTVFDKLPEQLDSAEAALGEERFVDAINDINEFLGRFGEKPPRTAPWSVPYAYNRLIEIYMGMGDYPHVVEAADVLLAKAADSRYAPLAHMAKIDALNLMSDEANLATAVGGFSTFVESNSLQARWRLEAELRGVLFDRSLQGAKRRAKLQEVANSAGSESPLVRNRATVAIGESLVGERKLEEAQKLFEKIVKDPQADPSILAAAHTGLGDCLYQRGKNLKDQGQDGDEDIRAASLHFLRVVVLYPDQEQYVPRALFYAGRTFQELGGEDGERRAQALYSKLIRTYPESKSAKEARSFRRRG